MPLAKLALERGATVREQEWFWLRWRHFEREFEIDFDEAAAGALVDVGCKFSDALHDEAQKSQTGRKPEEQ